VHGKKKSCNPKEPSLAKGRNCDLPKYGTTLDVSTLSLVVWKKLKTRMPKQLSSKRMPLGIGMKHCQKRAMIRLIRHEFVFTNTNSCRVSRTKAPIDTKVPISCHKLGADRATEATVPSHASHHNQPRSRGHPVREKEQKARKARGASRLSSID
jgi:hypothetical protein